MIAHALYGESSTSSMFAFYTFPCPMEDLALGFSIIFKVPLEGLVFVLTFQLYRNLYLYSGLIQTKRQIALDCLRML